MNVFTALKGSHFRFLFHFCWFIFCRDLSTNLTKIYKPDSFVPYHWYTGTSGNFNTCWKTINPVSSQSHVTVANRPLHRNRKSIPKFSSDKNTTFQNVTLQKPNLILLNRMLNIFPIWCNVNFVFSALNNTKKNRKSNFTLYWKHSIS